MVDRYLLREFNVADEELELAFDLSDIDFDSASADEMAGIYGSVTQTFESNQIIEGTIIRIDGDEVLA